MRHLMSDQKRRREFAKQLRREKKEARRKARHSAVQEFPSYVLVNDGAGHVTRENRGENYA